jgi:hypothetical protein
MVGRYYGGVERQRSKYEDLMPTDWEMAILAQNASDSFTDPAFSALNSADAMERYQTELMKTYVPEIRTPKDEDTVMDGRIRAKQLINLIANGGGFRGPRDLAERPEVVQSNASTYTYSVPSTDPINGVPQDKNGSYQTDSSGNTIYRMRLPNNMSNAELTTRWMNTNNRIAKYAANVKRVENTSRIVDWIPDRKDPDWRNRALDTIRHRIMPPQITTEDNGDGYNAEKNRCRDTDKVAYKYRHREYDVDLTLHEVLDVDTRIKPEIGPRESDGTPIGALVAEFAKQGKAYGLMENDIYINQLNKRDAYGGKRDTYALSGKQTFNNALPNGEDKDSGHASSLRTHLNIKSDTPNINLEDLDPIRKAIAASETIDEIKRKSKKIKVEVRRKALVNNSVTSDDGYNVDDDQNSSRKMNRKVNVEDGDTQHEIMQMQIPILLENFRKEFIVSRSAKKTSKTRTKKDYTTPDKPYVTGEESLNNNVRTVIQNGREIVSESQSGVRGLINDMIGGPTEFAYLNKGNVNGKKIKHGLKYADLHNKPNIGDELDGDRKKQIHSRKSTRPYLPEGTYGKSQIEFVASNAKTIRKKRGKVNQERDDNWRG